MNGPANALNISKLTGLFIAYGTTGFVVAPTPASTPVIAGRNSLTKGRAHDRGNPDPRTTSASAGSRGPRGRGASRGRSRGTDKTPFPHNFTWNRESLLRLAKWKSVNKKSMLAIEAEGVFPGYDAQQLQAVWNQHKDEAKRYLAEWETGGRQD